jgi:uncharacterized metal-binding protein
MSESKSCACGPAPKLIFACSGAADVGAITDHAARRLTSRGTGKMFCLAGLGGRVPAIMQTTASAAKVLAIDGCNLDCARLTLQQAGITAFTHLRLSDMGMEKGKSPASEDRIQNVVDRASAMLTIP